MSAKTVTIERLGHLGDGIAAGPIYAARTLPGEVIEGEVTGDRIQNPRIVTPSADRVRPPCRHYKSCGGCALQHASDAFVARWKVDVVRLALAAHGISPIFREIETSLPQSRRRATVSAKRTKSGASVGFHAPKSGIVSDISDCILLHPNLIAGLPAVQSLALVGASRKAELSASLTRSDNGLDIAVTGGKPLDGPLEIALAGEAEKWSLARLSWDGETIVTRQPPVQHFGLADVVPPPGGFLQATADGEQALVVAVTDAVSGSARIADLFAGCGTFTLPLAQQAEIHAIEAEPAMIQALDKAWRHASGLKRVTGEVRDLFRRPVFADDLNRYDAIVIDPPRAGAEAQINEIARSKVGRVAMVSCNPVTFARDAQILIAAGFVLEWVQVVDQFRWSAHVEMAARFVR